MINFRRLKLSDLDRIYKDKELSPLITTSYKGNSFVVVAELDKKIIGGVSGYSMGNTAFAKKTIVKDIEQRSVYFDGLMRSLIHFLQLDGLKYLFVEGGNPLYSAIGFKKLLGTEKFLKMEDEKIQAHFNGKHIYWINVKEFFK